MSAQFNFRKLWQMKFFLSFPVEVLLLHRILAVNHNLFQVCFFQILTLLHLLQNLNNCVHLFFGIHFCTAPQNSVFIKRKSSKDSFFLKCCKCFRGRNIGYSYEFMEKFSFVLGLVSNFCNNLSFHCGLLSVQRYVPEDFSSSSVLQP